VIADIGMKCFFKVITNYQWWR